MRVERALLDPDGIPGRPWYRHLVYAPKFTYAPEVLPGPAEAIAAGDEVRLREQCRKLAGGHRPRGGGTGEVAGRAVAMSIVHLVSS